MYYKFTTVNVHKCTVSNCTFFSFFFVSIERMWIVFIEYIESEKEENDTTKTEDLTREPDRVSKIKVIPRNKGSGVSVPEEEGIYFIFHGAPKTGNVWFTSKNLTSVQDNILHFLQEKS